MTHKKKLIEVALPLEAINKASAREKSIRHGHPSTLHLWWARRPLAAARAVIFAQMVDDPSAYVDTLRADPKLKRKAETALKARLKLWEEARELARKAKGTNLAVPEPGPQPTLDEILADIERQRLFRIIEDLVLWENTTNETVLQAARDEIWASWRRTCAENADHPRAKEMFNRNKLPAFHDPFAGGGALPLEAQRLGLESYASDLNPVAVLINKAMIEIPPKFAGKPPVNPESRKDKTLFKKEWRGAQGLAEDVRYYGQWMLDEAEKRIGHLYPKIDVTAAMAMERPDLKKYVGQKLTVIAWLWARTVRSPNPAFSQVHVPLVSTFMLSAKPGKEAYVEPLVEEGNYRFIVKVGQPHDVDLTNNGTRGGGRGGGFVCLLSQTPIDAKYIRAEAVAGRMRERLMAVAIDGGNGRIYLSPTPILEEVAQIADPIWTPEAEIAHWPGRTNVVQYGITRWRELFTSRQLAALSTFCELVSLAGDRAERDAANTEIKFDSMRLREGGVGSVSYGDSIATFLALALGRAADAWSSIVTWANNGEFTRGTFRVPGLRMAWDFAEANPFSDSCGNWTGACVQWVSRAVSALPAAPLGHALQADATKLESGNGKLVISTDPPYFDNICYAELSDFFYVWLRRSISDRFPELLSTVLVPKADELVANPYRHGGKERAEVFFMHGMTEAFRRIMAASSYAYPVTVFYAFKQTEEEAGDQVSTGWERFLGSLMESGISITGTWPVRTERSGRSMSVGQNALASSIVLVLRPRDLHTPNVTRREFVTMLKAELPVALAHLQRGNIAPVDLAQAAIGPGMAVYTRYAKVLDAEGKPLSVRAALALINQTLDEALAEQEGDFDADSRWAITWFEQVGFDVGEYGTAEQLSKSKNTSVSGLVEAGILASKSGKVRLLKPDELPDDWDPTTDKRLSSWETVHHLIRVLEAGGEADAAKLVSKLGAKAEVARELCYRLYTLCERKKRAAEALSYNGLVQSWPEITRLARENESIEDTGRESQTTMYGQE